MVYDPVQHEIDPATGFMVDREDGRYIGIVPAPAAKVYGDEFPKWVKAHESHLVRRKVDGAPDNVTTPWFSDCSVNRANGDVMVLVESPEEETMAGAERSSAPVADINSESYADGAARRAKEADDERDAAEEARKAAADKVARAIADSESAAIAKKAAADKAAEALVDRGVAERARRIAADNIWDATAEHTAAELAAHAAADKAVRAAADKVTAQNAPPASPAVALAQPGSAPGSDVRGEQAFSNKIAAETARDGVSGVGGLSAANTPQTWDGASPTPVGPTGVAPFSAPDGSRIVP